MSEAVITLDSLNGRLLYDKQEDWSGGVNNSTQPKLLAKNEFAGGRNTSIRKKGRLDLRPGSELWGSALGGTPQCLDFFKTSSIAARLVSIYSGELKYREHGGSWTAQAGMTLNATSGRVETRFFNSRTYVLSGNVLDNVWSWDGSAMRDHGTPATTTNPPNSPITCVQADRAWIGKGNLMYYSTALWDGTAGTGWNQVTQVVAVGGPAEEIVGCCAFGVRRILVIKETTTWVVVASSLTASEWYSYKVADVGGIHHKSMALMGENMVFWLAKEGVYVAQQMDEGNVNVSSGSLSEKVQGYMDYVDFTGEFDAIAHDDYYLLAYTKTDTSRLILVWDNRHKAWAGYWDTWAPSFWTKGKVNGQVRCFFIQSGQQAYEAFKGEHDNSVYPDMVATTRGLSWDRDGAGDMEKETCNIVNEYISAYGTTTFRILNSMSAAFSVASYSATASSVWGTLTWPITWASSSLASKRKIIPERRSLWWQIEITHTGGVVAIQETGLSAFMRPFRLTSLP